MSKFSLSTSELRRAHLDVLVWLFVLADAHVCTHSPYHASSLIKQSLLIALDGAGASGLEHPPDADSYKNWQYLIQDSCPRNMQDVSLVISACAISLYIYKFMSQVLITIIYNFQTTLNIIFQMNDH